MKEKMLKIGTVHQCNCCLGGKTLHPLVSVIDLSNAQLTEHTDVRFGFYTLLLSESKCEACAYCPKYYDYSDGTLVCLTPGQSINIECNNNKLPSKGWILAFHPDLIWGTVLSQNIRSYRFFTYRPEEALHLSLREKQIVIEFLNKINIELQRCIDRHSQKIISKYIELLLDYCIRFYERQFITRHEINKKIIEHLEKILVESLESRKYFKDNLSFVNDCVQKLGTSPDYLNDMMLVETGKSIQEYIQLKRFETAKKWLHDTSKTIQQISQELGFENPQYFSRLFKKLTGYSPDDFRIHN